jgi:hypothetical protein
LDTKQEEELRETKNELKECSQAGRLNGCNKPQSLTQKEKKKKKKRILEAIWKLEYWFGVEATIFSMCTQVENYRYIERNILTGETGYKW